MLLLEKFKDYIGQHRLFQRGDKVLLAVSGGRDSVVLCDLFHAAGFPFGIAHCNFQLRADESERDEAFVRKMASEYKAAFHVVKFDTSQYASQHKLSIQVAARELRYNWFEQVRGENGYAFIATAHHLNDSIETLLMNFFKGTGIGGLHGILPKQGRLIRPLLFAKREAIADYLQQRSLSFVEDSSNLSDKYTRNSIRLHIIPEIKKNFPELENNLADNIARFKEIEQLYRQGLEIHLEGLTEKRGEEIFISILKLQKSVPLNTVAYELFKPFNFNFLQAQQIIGMLGSESGRIIVSATHRLVKDRKWLIISPLQAVNDITYTLIEAGDRQVKAENIILKIQRIERAAFKLDSSGNAACLDLKKLSFPLVLRKWKQGDYFYPLGMKKKKKLSRFFIDQKLSLPEKEKIWVVESDKRIAWVAGMRIDERFKITDHTENILKLTLG